MPNDPFPLLVAHPSEATFDPLHGVRTIPRLEHIGNISHAIIALLGKGWQAVRHELKLRLWTEKKPSRCCAHEAELKAAGVEHLSIFGSVAGGGAIVDFDAECVRPWSTLEDR